MFKAEVSHLLSQACSQGCNSKHYPSIIPMKWHCVPTEEHCVFNTVFFDPSWLCLKHKLHLTMLFFLQQTLHTVKKEISDLGQENGTLCYSHSFMWAKNVTPYTCLEVQYFLLDRKIIISLQSLERGNNGQMDQKSYPINHIIVFLKIYLSEKFSDVP